jgi:hypothetical protein
MLGDRRILERSGSESARLLGRAAGTLLLAVAIAGCSATFSPSPIPPASPSPATATASDSAGPTAVATDTAVPTDTQTDVPTDVPVETDSPEPSASPMPTVAGKVLAWVAVQLPDALVAGSDSTFQNALFDWSRGYLAFHEDGVGRSVVPWTSADGRAWNQGQAFDMAGLDRGAWVGPVVEGPAGLIAVGRFPGCADDGSGCQPQPATALWSSSDGLAWSRVDLQKAFGEADVEDVSGGPKGYMAVGTTSDSGSPVPAVWLSADGRTWHPVSLSADTFKDAYLARATVLGGGFLAAGRIGSLTGWGSGFFPSTTPAVWWSADGTSWSRVTLTEVDAAPQAEAAVTKIATGKLVAHVVSWDCACPPEGDSQAWTSTDGRAWKAVRTAFPSPAIVESDGHQALQALQSPSADSVMTVATSSDGFKWTQLAVSGTGPTDLLDEAYGPAGLLVEDLNGNVWLASIGKAPAR